MSGSMDRSGGRRRWGAAVVAFLRRRALRGLAVGVTLLLLLPAIAPAQAGRLDFQPRTYGDGVWYTGVTLADMTGSSAPELLIGNRDTSSLEIWQATPQGEMNLIDSIPLIYHVHDVKAADFDHDGDMDIVVGLRNLGLFYVENTGGPGVVTSWAARSLDSSYSWQVLVADIDGDGHLDIFDGVDGGPIKTFYGDGHGQFAAGRAVAHPTEQMRFPYGFTLFDRNGDNRPDLIGVDGATMRVFINPGNRAAAWGAVANVPLGDTPSLRPRQAMSAVSPAAADLDGNGLIDQVAIVGTPDDPGDAAIKIIFGGGGGGIEWWASTLDTLPNRRFAGHVGVADVDGDGLMDVHVGGGQWFDGLRLYLKESAEGWFKRENVPLGYGVGGLNGFAAGDLNGDGGVDLVATRLSNSGGNNGGFVVLSGAARPAEGFWTTECVECPLFETYRSLTERALKIDSQGRPHVVVGGRDLLYVWHDGFNWHSEVVDFALGQSIAYPALALDAAGRPHVSYRGVDASLRYATKTAAGWQVEVVETDLSYYAGRTSLVLDGDGRPHIAYTVGDGSRTVKYATRTAAGWVSERVSADDAHGQSLALDTAGRPVLSLVSNEQLQYAVRGADGVWEFSDVAGVEADDSSLAFNSGGLPRIAYIRNGVIGYASLDSDWSVEAITTAGDAQGLALAIGPGDAAHVISYDINTRRVQHAFRAGQTWQTRLVATLAGSDGGLALALDAAGRPRAAFLDGYYAAALLKFSRADNAANWTWSSAETAATGGALGRPALALDSRSSQPSVSFCDQMQGNVLFARRGEDEWAAQTLPSLGGACESTWLGLDGANNAHVLYLTRDPQEWKYARRTNSGWQQEIVQPATSSEAAWAVSAAARPHLLYRDQRAGADALVYATRTTAGWQRENVITGDDTGFKPSLALDSQERPRVAYVNSQPAEAAELVYAWRDATGWHAEIVATAPVGSLLSTALAVGHDDVPRLVYAWVDPRMQGIVTYAQRGADGWQQQEVGLFAGSTEPQHMPVLALGPDDAPHVAYSDPAWGVYYGTRGAAGWQFQRLVGGAATPALAVDTIGQPHLANSDGSVTYQAWYQNWPALGDPEVFLSAGAYHTCGLRTSGAADCWGATEAANDRGQVADQSGPFVQVVAGMFFSCGLRLDGAADCWGAYEYGPAEDNAGPFSHISAGQNHVCGLRRDGGATCWGMLVSSGVTDDQDGPFVQLGAGMDHSCGLRADGRVLCWGFNQFGQLDAPAGPFTQISAGRRHTCGLLANGGAVCWGDNGAGQAEDQAGPFIQLSAGTFHTCGLRRDGTAFCWGRNDTGQTAAPGGLFNQISAGGAFYGEPLQAHTCGLRPDGRVVCWGSNGNGQAVGQGPGFGPFAPLVRLPIILRK